MPNDNWSSPTLQESYDLFLLDCRAQKFTKPTIDFYHYRLPAFFAWLTAENVTTLDAVRSSHIKSYLIHCQSRNVSDGYLHGIARAIRRFFNYCVDDELIESSPMRKVKMPRVERRILRSFSKDEISQLLDACRNHRERAIILFLLDTGVRASEFVNLDWADIEIESGRVIVRRGKMRKDRFVFLGARSLKQLRRYAMKRTRQPETPIFPSRQTGERLNPNGLRLLLRRIERRAGLKGVSPHAFRRTFALWSLRAGMNIYVLMRLMGHEQLSTLIRYLGLNETDLASGHERFGPVDNTL